MLLHLQGACGSGGEMKLRTVGAFGSVVLVGVVTSSAVQAAMRPAPMPAVAWVRDYNGVTPVNIYTRTAGSEIPYTASSSGFEPLPDGIAVTPDGRMAYVSSEADSDSGTVTPIDLKTGTAEPQISVGSYPGEIAISPDGKTAYVDNRTAATGSVTPIDVATNTLGTQIPVLGPDGALAISPDGKTLWVESRYGPGSLWLTPIDLANGTAGASFMVGSGWAGGMTITPNGKTLYLTNYRRQLIRVDTASHAVTVITLPVNMVSWGVAVNPAGSQVDVVSIVDHFMVGVRVATNAVGTAINLPDSTASSVTWGPAGRTAWVTDGGLVPVTGLTVGESIPTAGPNSAAITPDQPPLARFTATTHGTRAKFDATASYPQSTAIATYAWNFGDGTTTTTTTPTITHTYTTPGTYTVTLTLTDKAGTSTTQIYTGQSMLRDGSGLARATHTLHITEDSALSRRPPRATSAAAS
jgi:YVTN family beta-propeller protein